MPALAFRFAPFFALALLVTMISVVGAGTASAAATTSYGTATSIAAGGDRVCHHAAPKTEVLGLQLLRPGGHRG